jgi:thiol:disulfide interchange protein DsbD
LRIVCTLALLLALLWHGPVFAQYSQENAAAPKNYVKIRVLPERSRIKPGEELWIGIEQSIEPGWHTYWINPGDSGAEPRVKWKLPEGFKMSGVLWPAPERLPYGPLMNYGYKDHVILLQKLKAPETLPDGPLTLKADVEILVCQEECIPERGSFELVLNDTANEGEDNTDYLTRARARLPDAAPWKISYAVDDSDLILKIPDAQKWNLANIDLDSVVPFFVEWGLVMNTAPIHATLEGDTLTIRQNRGERQITDDTGISGVLSYRDSNGKASAYVFKATNVKAPPAAEIPTESTIAASNGSAGIITALMLALLGGLILNLMPCVFPILSIKALGLVKIAHTHPGRARLSGLAYSAGVIISFIAIAGILIVLKAGGTQVGWGFQLQNPVLVSLLAYMLFIIGLNLAGLFEIGGHFGNLGNKLTQGDGTLSSFFTGVLATLVATPCTAPFMAGAIGFALTQPEFIALAVFAALGFGLALPYLMLSFVPALQKILPRPGAWMETFRQFLAFPMFAAAIWLVWVLSQQAGSMAVFGILIGMLAITFALWLLRRAPVAGATRLLVKIFAILCFLLALGFLPAGMTKPAIQTEQTTGFGQPYTPEKLAAALESNMPVFVEMTAAWCITCKVNHAVAIDIESTRTLFSENNITYLVGDWTNEDPLITAYLDSFGRNGVPLYIYYGPRDKETGIRPQPRILPQILTPGLVRETITGS